MVDKGLLHSRIMETFENLMNAVESLLQKQSQIYKMWHTIMEGILRIWSSPPRSLIEKPGMAQIRNIVGMNASQILGIHVCPWALEKMPEAGSPNLVKHSSPEMPIDPCVLHWDGGGPISRHHSLEWLPSEKGLQGRYLQPHFCRRCKILFTNYAVSYDHNAMK